MNKQEMISLIESIIEESKTVVLATVDKECLPHMRWVTPCCIRQRPGYIYMITSPELSKFQQIQNNPMVEIMIQTASLDKIINIKGKVFITQNPLIRSEVLECVAKNLQSFWKISSNEEDLVVLETTIQKAHLYIPQKGIREHVDFESGESL